jgi:hypothetical protein
MGLRVLSKMMVSEQCKTTVNRNRMVRLAGPRDKYVSVLSLLTSRDEIRGRLFWKVFSRYIVDVVCASIFRHCLT